MWCCSYPSRPLSFHLHPVPLSYTVLFSSYISVIPIYILYSWFILVGGGVLTLACPLSFTQANLPSLFFLLLQILFFFFSFFLIPYSFLLYWTIVFNLYSGHIVIVRGDGIWHTLRVLALRSNRAQKEKLGVCLHSLYLTYILTLHKRKFDINISLCLW